MINAHWFKPLNSRVACNAEGLSLASLPLHSTQLIWASGCLSPTTCPRTCLTPTQLLDPPPQKPRQEWWGVSWTTDATTSKQVFLKLPLLPSVSWLLSAIADWLLLPSLQGQGFIESPAQWSRPMSDSNNAKGLSCSMELQLVSRSRRDGGRDTSEHSGRHPGSQALSNSQRFWKPINIA